MIELHSYAIFAVIIIGISSPKIVAAQEMQATEPKSSLFDGTAPPVYHFRRFDLYHFMT
jgi:hypothetical protein